MLSLEEELMSQQVTKHSCMAYPFYMDKFIINILGFIHEDLCCRNFRKPFSLSEEIEISTVLKLTGCSSVEFGLAIFDYFDIFVDFLGSIQILTIGELIVYIRMHVSESGADKVSILI